MVDFILSPWITFYIWVQWISSSSLFIIDIVSDWRWMILLCPHLERVLEMRWLYWWFRCCYPDHEKRENQREKRQFKTDSVFPALCNKRQNGMNRSPSWKRAVPYWWKRGQGAHQNPQTRIIYGEIQQNYQPYRSGEPLLSGTAGTYQALNLMFRLYGKGLLCPMN